MKQIKISLYITVEDFQEESMELYDAEHGANATAEMFAKQIAEIVAEEVPYGVEVINYKGENFNITPCKNLKNIFKNN